MAISKTDKENILKGYLEMLANAQGMVVTEYRGMGMKNLNTLRGLLRPIKGSYTITKNTLFKLALREVGFAVPEDNLVLAIDYLRNTVGNAPSIEAERD